MANTIPHSIFYPEAGDLIKDPNSTAKLAVDIARLAISANSAIATAEARARGEAQALDVANRNAWGNAVESTLDQAMAYTDNAFAAAGEGGATDEQVDAAIDRAVLQGRVADSDRLPSGDRTAVGRGDFGILAADHGAVADGVTNDRHRINEALTVAQGRDVILEGGKTYLITGSIVIPTGQDALSIRAVGAKPAILKLGGDGQSNPAINADAGDPVLVSTVTASVGINTRGWPVASTTGIEKGMLCEVVSSAPWYHDPRPESAPLDARKSELHKVQDTFDGRVWMDDPAFDSYDLANETVELRFYKPIRVRLENITVQGTLPAVAEESKAVQGIIIQGASEPLLIDVNAENCARTGVGIYRSYRPRSYGGYTRGSNNFYNGYGFVINGCTHGYVQDRMTFESKKGVDITGFNCVSRMTVVRDCKTIGGGKNSRGEYYGWNPDGTAAAHQAGFGSHGGSEDAYYINNTTVDLQVPYSIRGRNSYVDGCLHKGRATGGFVQAAMGTNLYVTNNKIISGWWSLKVANSFTDEHIYGMRCDTIVTIYENWQSAVGGARRGQLVVSGNEAELRRSLVRMHILNFGQMNIVNNRATFIDKPGAITTFYTLDNNSGANPTTAQAAQWTIGPNDIQVPDSTMTHTVSNRTIAGAKVLNYSIAT